MSAPNLSDILIVALPVVVTLLAVHSGINLVLLARGVRSWRTVDGRVEYFHDYSIMGGKWARPIGTGIEIKYTYSYGAAEFNGHCVTVVDFPPRLWATQYGDLASGLKTAYVEKKLVRVLVNPEKPHQAVLSTPSVTPQLHRSVAAILMVLVVVSALFLQEMTITTWMCGIGLGVIVYGLFVVGLFSTAF